MRGAGSLSCPATPAMADEWVTRRRFKCNRPPLCGGGNSFLAGVELVNPVHFNGARSFIEAAGQHIVDIPPTAKDSNNGDRFAVDIKGDRCAWAKTDRTQTRAKIIASCAPIRERREPFAVSDNRARERVRRRFDSTSSSKCWLWGNVGRYHSRMFPRHSDTLFPSCGSQGNVGRNEANV